MLTIGLSRAGSRHLQKPTGYKQEINQNRSSTSLHSRGVGNLFPRYFVLLPSWVDSIGDRLKQKGTPIGEYSFLII